MLGYSKVVLGEARWKERTAEKTAEKMEKERA